MNLQVLAAVLEADLASQSTTTVLRRAIKGMAIRGLLLPAGATDFQHPSASKGELWKVPSHWRTVALSEIAMPQAGFAFDSARFNTTGTGIPLIRIRDIRNDRTESFYSGGYRDDFLVSPGEYLIGMDGNFNVACWRGPRALLNQRVTRLRWKSESVLPAFVVLALQEYLWSLQGKKQYTTVDHLSTKQIASAPVPIPPLAEQKRIVAKVDELMALCDRLEAQLKQRDEQAGVLAKAAVARFQADPTVENLEYLFHPSYAITGVSLREAVLGLAIRGRLMPSRGEEGEALAEMIADGIDPVLAVPSVDEQRFPVPPSWCWVRFWSVGGQRLGKMLDSAKNSGKLRPYLRNTSVQWSRFALDDLKLMRISDDEAEEYRLCDGDLLICEGGEPGRCAIWRSQATDMYFQKALHRVRPRPSVTSEYLAMCLQLDAATGVLSGLFTGATIKHLTGRSLAEYAIPLPPLAEQRRIVTKVNELMALVDRLESQITASEEAGTKLLDALVAELAPSN